MASDYISQITASNGTTYDITGIFIAEIGTTSYADILEAYNNKRLVFGHCVMSGDGEDAFFVLRCYLDGYFTFYYYQLGDIFYTTSVSSSGWTGLTSIQMDKKVTVAENTKSTKYYPILATGIGTSTRQIDTNDQVNTAESRSGLYYQNGYLFAPGLYVGDVDYTISSAEYQTLMSNLDTI